MSICSDALLYENELTVDTERKKRVKTYIDKAGNFIELSESNINRAKELIQLGFKSLDALHIALAEEASAEYFVTCDNRIIKKRREVQDKLKVKVRSILELIAEVVYVKNIEGN